MPLLLLELFTVMTDNFKSMFQLERHFKRILEREYLSVRIDLEKSKSGLGKPQFNQKFCCTREISKHRLQVQQT